jgi:hypothetical protein
MLVSAAMPSSPHTDMSSESTMNLICYELTLDPLTNCSPAGSWPPHRLRGLRLNAPVDKRRHAVAGKPRR